jgi:hypothetical protein
VTERPGENELLIDSRPSSTNTESTPTSSAPTPVPTPSSTKANNKSAAVGHDKKKKRSVKFRTPEKSGADPSTEEQSEVSFSRFIADTEQNGSTDDALYFLMQGVVNEIVESNDSIICEWKAPWLVNNRVSLVDNHSLLVQSICFFVSQFLRRRHVHWRTSKESRSIRQLLITMYHL